MTHSPCNRILWNRQSSKTRAGMPCIGCTEPGFPHNDLEVGTVFKTQKIFGVIPKEIPEGTDPASYSVLAAVARARPRSGPRKTCSWFRRWCGRIASLPAGSCALARFAGRRLALHPEPIPTPSLIAIDSECSLFTDEGW